ncbi:hypothetical protein BCT71_12540 [Vibrio sp. 10N.261.51.A7]|nr:hypothetical protein BCT71_12540 [Vibrio sp. 10N.261.51.A7]
MELTLAYLELLFVIGRKTIDQEYSDKGWENTEGACCWANTIEVNLLMLVVDILGVCLCLVMLFFLFRISYFLRYKMFF